MTSQERTVSPLPCPLCGHKADYYPAHPHDGDRTIYHVECNDCGAQGPHLRGLVEALAAWNRRAPGAPASGIGTLDALQSAIATMVATEKEVATFSAEYAKQDYANLDAYNAALTRLQDEHREVTRALWAHVEAVREGRAAPSRSGDNA